MEQLPEREGTIPAPSSGEGTRQLPKEAVGGEEMPAGSQDSPALDGQATMPRGGEADVPSRPGMGQQGCASHLPSDEHPREDAREKQPAEGGGSLPGAPVPSLDARAVGLPAESPQTRTPSREAEADFYCVKWITWKGERTPVIMQSENGPCPLLAIMNILFLQWKASRVLGVGWGFGGAGKGGSGSAPPGSLGEGARGWSPASWCFQVKLPPQKEVITAEELMAHLGDCILSTQPREPSEGLQLNFQQVRSEVACHPAQKLIPPPSQGGLVALVCKTWGAEPFPSKPPLFFSHQNINDTMTVLPKLSTGLDVNVRFTGVSDFEYTPECIVFDLLNVPLYHGWLVDPQSPEVMQAVGKLSYNQLVEKIITCKQASDSSLVSEGLVAEQFLESTASQLTYHGLCELTAAVREGELSVFFRNNHFSTMIKHKGHLYLLVTDQGFLQEEGVVWESLHNVDGDSCFCDTDFHLSHAPGKEGATAAPLDHRLQQRQVDQDYMIALSLQQQQGQDPSVLSDLELAHQLQQEEYHHHHQQQQQRQQQVPVQGRAQPGGRPAGERRQRQKPDLDCTLL
uniref:Ubiquitin carboxyl-terminal hydrolase n=1 Tax=Aquila chrysaetos chrysaetos TaxID=223781 RepID=A0A663DQ78_AQUCH